MASIPLDPVITPRIELSRNPAVYLVLTSDDEWVCPVCQERFALEQEGHERRCISCLIKTTGKTSVMILGWTVYKMHKQLIAQPPTHRVDGK